MLVTGLTSSWVPPHPPLFRSLVPLPSSQLVDSTLSAVLPALAHVHTTIVEVRRCWSWEEGHRPGRTKQWDGLPSCYRLSPPTRHFSWWLARLLGVRPAMQGLHWR